MRLPSWLTIGFRFCFEKIYAHFQRPFATIASSLPYGCRKRDEILAVRKGEASTKIMSIPWSHETGGGVVGVHVIDFGRRSDRNIVELVFSLLHTR